MDKKVKLFLKKEFGYSKSECVTERDFKYIMVYYFR